MCHDCWVEEGKPQIDNEKVRAAAAMLVEEDDFGPLHIIVSDWNLEDHNIEFCRTETDHHSGIQPNTDLLDLLASMTMPERSSAMAKVNGFPTLCPKCDAEVWFGAVGGELPGGGFYSEHGWMGCEHVQLGPIDRAGM